jgi:hypothetical protein
LYIMENEVKKGNRLYRKEEINKIKYNKKIKP